MPTTPQTEAAIAGLFETELNIAVPSPETDLMETGLLNSVSFVELVMLIEERLGVTVPLDELELDQFRTLKGVAAYVDSLSSRLEASRQGSTAAA